MLRLLSILTAVLLLGATPARAATVPINSLIEQAKAFDGQVVTIEGEVIGDLMIRGEYGWINLSDGTNDLGVWAPAGLLRQITKAGRYHETGDRVRVTGEFRRADPEHGGDLLLRAASLEILTVGGPVEHPVKPGRPLLAAVALALAGVLGLVRWRSRVRA